MQQLHHLLKFQVLHVSPIEITLRLRPQTY